MSSDGVRLKAGEVLVSRVARSIGLWTALLEPLVECGPGGEVGSEAAEPDGEFGSRLDGARFAEPEWLGCLALSAANAHAHKTTCPLRSIVALFTIIGRLDVELNRSTSLSGRLTIW
jgi:hypothetical protein